LQAGFRGPDVRTRGEGRHGHVEIHPDRGVGHQVGIADDRILTGADIEQIPERLTGHILPILQIKQAVAGRKQGLLCLQGLHGSHLAEFVLGFNETEQFLVAFDAGVHDLDGFVKVFQLEIGVRHVVDEGQPCGFPVFHRGLVFPFLRVGGVAELLPQVDLVAHPEFGLVRARGVAVVDVVGRGG